MSLKFMYIPVQSNPCWYVKKSIFANGHTDKIHGYYVHIIVYAVCL